jgi:hypothetical protein
VRARLVSAGEERVAARSVVEDCSPWRRVQASKANSAGDSIGAEGPVLNKGFKPPVSTLEISVERTFSGSSGPLKAAGTACAAGLFVAADITAMLGAASLATVSASSVLTVRNELLDPSGSGADDLRSATARPFLTGLAVSFSVLRDTRGIESAAGCEAGFGFGLFELGSTTGSASLVGPVTTSDVSPTTASDSASFADLDVSDVCEPFFDVRAPPELSTFISPVPSAFDVDAELADGLAESGAEASVDGEAPEGESAEAAEGVEPDDDESDEEAEDALEPESDGSANATPGVVATAIPTPSANASGPTRPMNFADLI